MFNKTRLIGFLMLFSSIPLIASVTIIPMPASVTQTSDGVFEFTPQTVLVADASLQRLAKQLDEFLCPAFGFHLSEGNSEQTENIVQLQLNNSLKSLGSEGYRLTVGAKVILIEAYQPAGIFYGIQTLRQLLPVEIFKHNKAENIKWRISSVEISDTPRFEWRGSHLDVSRHFMPVEFVKKYIDLMAIHKLNRFHWHLTDSDGWRIEIKKYPKLTEVGSKRDRSFLRRIAKDPNTVYDSPVYGSYYTQEQIREVIQYAKDRFVEIMPEIEMPGHSGASVLSYPWLSCDGQGAEYCPASEAVFRFNEDVLREVIDLFPTKYIHIGGDEVGKKRWQTCLKCQATIAAEGLKDVNDLQPYFTARIEKFVTESNRRLVGWDDILEGKLNPQSVVMCWRKERYAVEAANRGNDVIMVPASHCYFDYYQGDKNTEPLAIGGFLPLEKVYSYNPMPAELMAPQQKHILGVQFCLWAEFVSTPQHAEYMAYPRGCAMAEVGWVPFEQKNYEDFTARLNEHLKRLDHYGVNYRRLDK